MIPRPRKKKYPAALWIDRATRAVLAVVFALAAGAYFRSALMHWHQGAVPHSLFAQAVEGFSIFSVGLYTFLIACLYAIRLRPVNKFAGLMPAVTALAGGFLVCGLLVLPPRTDLPVSVSLAGAGLVLIGNIFAVAALARLGRSFSILPEGRKLVTGGPYRFVRHPLYIAEAVATLGAMISFLSPAAAALVAAQLLLQFGRIHYEEKVLRATFPAYANYSRRTARLIPGLY